MSNLFYVRTCGSSMKLAVSCVASLRRILGRKLMRKASLSTIQSLPRLSFKKLSSLRAQLAHENSLTVGLCHFSADTFVIHDLLITNDHQTQEPRISCMLTSKNHGISYSQSSKRDPTRRNQCCLNKSIGFLTTTYASHYSSKFHSHDAF